MSGVNSWCYASLKDWNLASIGLRAHANSKLSLVLQAGLDWPGSCVRSSPGRVLRPPSLRAVVAGAQAPQCDPASLCCLRELVASWPAVPVTPAFPAFLPLLAAQPTLGHCEPGVTRTVASSGTGALAGLSPRGFRGAWLWPSQDASVLPRGFPREPPCQGSLPPPWWTLLSRPKLSYLGSLVE